jgi:hypothetical protein
MHKNFLAYDNYEIFNNSIEEDLYIESKLKSCDEQINFIKKIPSEIEDGTNDKKSDEWIFH